MSVLILVFIQVSVLVLVIGIGISIGIVVSIGIFIVVCIVICINIGIGIRFGNCIGITIGIAIGINTVNVSCEVRDKSGDTKRKVNGISNNKIYVIIWVYSLTLLFILMLHQSLYRFNLNSFLEI